MDGTPIRILHCPTCEGRGELRGKRCTSCDGRGVVARHGPLLLSWGWPMGPAHAAQRALVALAEQVITVLLLCLGALGAGALVWQAMLLNWSGTPLWRFTDVRSPWTFTFWLSLLPDSYLVYHFSRITQRFHRLPSRLRRGDQSAVAPPSPTWETATRVPRRDRVDVAGTLTEPARHAVERAWQLAAKHHHREVASLHLLIALLSDHHIGEMFVRLGISYEQLKRRLRPTVARYAVPAEHGLLMGDDLYASVFSAYAETVTAHQRKVDVVELFAATVGHSAVVRDLMLDLGVDGAKIANVTVWLRSQRQFAARLRVLQRRAAYRPKRSRINRAMTAVATPYLDHFGQDLTQLARAGYLEPCLDREREHQEIFRILTLSTHRSVVLVGNPGVGKRSIINGIAYLMVAEEVPPLLRDKRLVSLSVANLVGGANPSVAQERLLRSLQEAERAGNIVLAINDVSKMVGVAPGGSASLDLAGTLAQALQQTRLPCLATSLPADYRRYLEPHLLGTSLERVDITEPTGDAAIQILEAKSSPIEARTGVYFTYDAIANAVTLSSRYLHERYLPEKALEVLEETAVRVANEKGRQAAVTGADVAATLAAKTQIPLTEVTQAESVKLLNLEAELHQRIVGQDEAVKLVATAIRRARAELRDQQRPIVNLLFLGPTGVGKTELAKAVAAVYFGTMSELIRLDMSEYQEQSSINRLIGAPPSAAGEGTGGYLTEAVRGNPFAVLLLDEFEKAHPDLLNVFLQIMDDGRCTDALGRTIDFTNVILIATSNACTETIQRLVAAGVDADVIKEQLIGGELQQHFRAELLNRFDGIVVFRPLSREQVQAITRLLLRQVGERLAEKGVRFAPTDAAVEELANDGFDPRFGARPLRRLIQERVDDAIALKVLKGELHRRDTVILDVGGAVTVKPAPAR